jgi:hypothetical protein
VYDHTGEELTLMLSKGRVAMTPDQLTGAARDLAHGLGIPVYIRDGRIYQHGPGVEFLPRKGTALGAPSGDEDFFTKTD